MVSYLTFVVVGYIFLCDDLQNYHFDFRFLSLKPGSLFVWFMQLMLIAFATKM